MFDIKDTTHSFSINNLPYGVYSLNSNQKMVGVRIFDYILDLHTLYLDNYFAEIKQITSTTFNNNYLNAFISLGRHTWTKTRSLIKSILNNVDKKYLIPIDNKVQMHLPLQIGDYTDFYASKEHATNVGTMFRGKDNALMPNWTRMPIGYHGRASSVVNSGALIKRPNGQYKLNKDDKDPVFGKCLKLDMELEMAFVVGKNNNLGDSVKMSEAEDYIFGAVLMNDWSARDIQAWEYVPLGPFLGKSFATSISSWVTTMDALDPFKCELPQQIPTPMQYLQNMDGSNMDGYDINLEVMIKCNGQSEYHSVCKSNLKYMYWSFKQQLVHHTVNGCNLRVGDLCGSGTISGPTENSYGSLLELTWNGQKELSIGHQKRKFLEDGDTVKVVGYCSSNSGTNVVMFGDCIGTIAPAHD